MIDGVVKKPHTRDAQRSRWSVFTTPGGLNMYGTVKYIKVKELPIRFGQFLKLAELVGDGVEAKTRIQSGEFLLNGIVETQRGKKLNRGDTVTLKETSFRVT
jgi:ribosome-associated protein